MITKEIIKEFGRELKIRQDPFWLDKNVMYVKMAIVTDEETGAGYDDEITVDSLEKEDIKAIAEWLGETVYLYLDGCSITLNPDKDEVECGVWEAIY